MTARSAVLSFAALAVAASLAYLGFHDLLSGAWFAFEVPPDVEQHLENSLEDQRRLASLDPVRVHEYRGRHESLSQLGRHLDVVSLNRERIVDRFRSAALALMGGTLAVFVLVAAARQKRDLSRLSHLGTALEELSWGRGDITLGERGRDAIGRFARMIESVSERVARDRRRLETLENLSRWQESARRHAHEMRTPLTAARLELERLLATARNLEPDQRTEIEDLGTSIGHEIERLAEFTTRFTRFAKLPRPKPTRHDLDRLARDLATTFAEAWTEMSLEIDPASKPTWAFADRGMLRQVLVNLCENSHQAGAARVRLTATERAGLPTLEVRDDGPGIDEELRSRLFDPYVTTREVGEGMGLGLAISKKILLDHGGDLELLPTEVGAAFRLTLSPPPPEEET